MSTEDVLAVVVGIILGIGILVVLRSFGKAETGSWDDVRERRNGDG